MHACGVSLSVCRAADRTGLDMDSHHQPGSMATYCHSTAAAYGELHVLRAFDPISHFPLDFWVTCAPVTDDQNLFKPCPLRVSVSTPQ